MLTKCLDGADAGLLPLITDAVRGRAAAEVRTGQAVSLAVPARHSMRSGQLGDRPTGTKVRLDQEPPLLHRRPPPRLSPMSLHTPQAWCRLCPEIGYGQPDQVSAGDGVGVLSVFLPPVARCVSDAEFRERLVSLIV
jgi:hypothetical protein